MVVFNQMMCLFLMIALGYGVGKWGIISPQMSGGLSSMVVKITCPMMVLSSVMTAKPEGTMQEIFMVFVLSIGLYIIFPFPLHRHLSFPIDEILPPPSNHPGAPAYP